MKKPKPSVDESEFPFYQIFVKYRGLMRAIFGERQFYLSIIREGEEVSLGEAVEEVLNTLPHPSGAKVVWTKEDLIRVITLRFGLGDGGIRTLEKVGEEFKVTRERIRQVENKTLRKLRRSELLNRFLILAPQEREEKTKKERNLKEASQRFAEVIQGVKEI